MLEKRLRRYIYLLLVITLVFAPYSTFFWQLVRHVFNVAGSPLPALLIKLTVGWKEVLLLLSSFLFGLLWVAGRKFPFKITRLDWYILIFTGVGTLWGAVISSKIAPVVFGFRYDFSVFVYYFVARAVIVSREDLIGLLRKLVLLSLPVLIFALAQTFYLPYNFMERFGYSWGMSVTGNPLPPYHLVLNKIVRAISTFPGPNSLAMYSVVILLIGGFVSGFWLKRYWRLGLVVLALLVLAITFSRAHLLSIGMASLISYGFWRLSRTNYGPSTIGWMLGAGAIFFLIASFAATIYAGNLKSLGPWKTVQSLVLHEESSAIHRDVRERAWEIIKRNPFGTGLGTSGLATTNTGGEVFNPESWYMQMTQELGWFGIVMAVALLLAIYRIFPVMEKDLIDQKDRQLLFYFFTAFGAVAFSANFLPSWFEVGSIFFWILFAFFLTDYLNSFPKSQLLQSQKRS